MIFRPVRERPVDESGCRPWTEMIAKTAALRRSALLSLSSSDYTYVAELVRRTMEEARRQAPEASACPACALRSFSARPDKNRRKRPPPLRLHLRPRSRHRPPARRHQQADRLRRPAGHGRGGLQARLDDDQDVLHDWPSHADARRRAGYRRPGEGGTGRRPPSLGKKANVRIGVSTLVPKPHTPFQWVPMEDEAVIRSQIELLQRSLRGPGIHFSWNDPEETLVEAFLTRGDCRMGDVIQRAWRPWAPSSKAGASTSTSLPGSSFCRTGHRHGFMPFAPARLTRCCPGSTSQPASRSSFSPRNTSTPTKVAS